MLGGMPRLDSKQRGRSTHHRKQGKEEEERNQLHGRSDQEGDAKAVGVDKEAPHHRTARPAEHHDSLHSIPPCTCSLHASRNSVSDPSLRTLHAMARSLRSELPFSPALTPQFSHIVYGTVMG